PASLPRGRHGRIETHHRRRPLSSLLTAAPLLEARATREDSGGGAAFPFLFSGRTRLLRNRWELPWGGRRWRRRGLFRGSRGWIGPPMVGSEGCPHSPCAAASGWRRRRRRDGRRRRGCNGFDGSPLGWAAAVAGWPLPGWAAAVGGLGAPDSVWRPEPCLTRSGARLELRLGVRVRAQRKEATSCVVLDVLASQARHFCTYI
ncbi:unnamed protein product, partial [Urochloa humidicola]